MFRLVVLLASLALCASQTCPSGGEIYEWGISESGKDAVIAAHNKYRQMALNGEIPNQPKATSMNMLTYDNVLGEKGQVVSETCEMNHIIAEDDRWWWVGQNLYMSMSTSPSEGQEWENAVQSWYSEHVDFTYPDQSTPGKATGHYTQVVWAETTHLGCDFISFHKPNDAWPYRKLYTCNYGVGGNVQGEAPYPI